jgi:hypothetical protein
VSDYNHLESLKDREFVILEKLSSNTVSADEKDRLEKELEEVRREIEELR